MTTKLNYRINLLRITANSAFKEASKEELRTLVALIESEGKAEDAQELSRAADTSLARCKAALAFWEESGVIREDDGSPSITDEFDDRLVRGEISEVPAVEVAESIRNEDLAGMIDECALLLGQACLSNSEVKDLTALYTQYSLSPEYIATLTAYKAQKGKTTVKRICDEAIRLSSKGIDTVEALDTYLKNLEESSGTEWEIRRAIGIYNRNLSPSERGYFKKWSETYGYSVTIITEAYDIAVLNTKSGDLRYMDAILTSWYEAGCRTISECKARSEAESAKISAEKAAKKTSKTQPETPRYGNFDVNEAFMNALERSFKSEDD